MATEDEITWSSSEVPTKLNIGSSKKDGELNNLILKKENNKVKDDIVAAVFVCMSSLFDKGTAPPLKHTSDIFKAGKPVPHDQPY